MMAHGFRGFSPQLTGSKAGTLWRKDLVEHRCLDPGGQEAEQGSIAKKEEGSGTR